MPSSSKRSINVIPSVRDILPPHLHEFVTKGGSPAKSLSGVNGMGDHREVPIKNIRLDGGTQSRVRLNLDVVNIYAEQMEAESPFPPIDVYYDSKDYWLADGWHRLEAAKKLGFIHIGAIVHEGSQRDAVWHSLKANKQHGLQRSDDDKRRAVTTVLEDEEWSQWSDRHISRELGVSPTLVGDLRRELTVHVDSSEIESAQRKYVRDGQTRTMKTGNIRGKTAETKPVDVIEYNHMGHQTYAIDIDAKTVSRAKSARSWEPIYYAIEDHVRGEEKVLVFVRYDGGFPNLVYVACRDSAAHAANSTERIVETDIMVATAMHPVIAFSDYEFHTDGALRQMIEQGYVIIVWDGDKTLGNLTTVKDAMGRQVEALERAQNEEQRRSEEALVAIRKANSLVEHPDPAAAARAAIFGETPLSSENFPIPGLPTNGSAAADTDTSLLGTVNLMDDPDYAARAAEDITHACDILTSLGLSKKASQLALESVAGIPGFLTDIFGSHLEIFAKAYFHQTQATTHRNGSDSPTIHELHQKIDDHFESRYAISDSSSAGVRSGYHRYFAKLDDPAVSFRVQYLIAERWRGEAKERVWLEIAEKKLKTQAQWLAVLAPESGSLHLIKTKRLTEWLEDKKEFRDRDERNGRVGIVVQLEDLVSFAQVEEVTL